LATARDEKKALDKSAKKATAGGSGTARNYGNGPEKKNPSGPKDPSLQVMYDTLANTKKLSETQLAALKLALMKKNEEGYDEAKTKAAAKALRGLYRGYAACGDDQKKRDEFMSGIAGLSTATDMVKAAEKIVAEVENNEKNSSAQPQEQPQEVNASYYDEQPEDDIEVLSEEFDNGSYIVEHDDVKAEFETLDDATGYMNQVIEDATVSDIALYDRTGEYDTDTDLMVRLSKLKETTRGNIGYYPVSIKSKRIELDPQYGDVLVVESEDQF
jgi:hypothetical protein